MLLPAYQTFMHRREAADARTKFWTYEFLSLASPTCRTIGRDSDKIRFLLLIGPEFSGVCDNTIGAMNGILAEEPGVGSQRRIDAFIPIRQFIGRFQIEQAHQL